MIGAQAMNVAGPLPLPGTGGVLRLFDLDGTLTTPSFMSPEGQTYLGVAAQFVASEIPAFFGSTYSVIDGVLKAITQFVEPNRHRPQFWAEFPTVEGRLVRVCPSVDHFLQTQFGMRVFLEVQAINAAPGSTLTTSINAFLADPQWANRMYAAAAAASSPFAQMDDDARTALEAGLTREDLMAIFTNSSVKKARDIATRAGFGEYLVEGRVERGKLGLIGDGRKFAIHEAWPEATRPAQTRWGDQVDVTEYFGVTATVDLRRSVYYRQVAKLMTDSGASQVWMVGDIPTLDLLPLANWTDFHPTVVMRRTPMSAPQEERVVTELIGGRVVDTLSEAVAGLE